MSQNSNKPAKQEKKEGAKKLAIRIICLVLAVSMVIATVYMLYAYIRYYLS